MLSLKCFVYREKHACMYIHIYIGQAERQMGYFINVFNENHPNEPHIV